MINAVLPLSCASTETRTQASTPDEAHERDRFVVTVAAPPRLPPPIRVASFNILAGRFGLERVAAAIKQMDVDVIGLQEVDRNTGRSGGADQAAALASLLGMHHVFAPALAFDDGEYGVALLSRAPLEHTRVIKLPTAPKSEPRVLLMAHTELEGQNFVIATTHLSAAIEGAAALAMHRSQSRTLAEALGARERCVLLADLNDEASNVDLVGLDIVGRFLGLDAGPTYPARDPTQRIDHIIASPDLYALAFAVHATRSSDHRAISATLGRRRP